MSKKPVPTRDNLTPADLFRSMIPTAAVRAGRAMRLVALVHSALVSEDGDLTGELIESMHEALLEAYEDLRWLCDAVDMNAIVPTSDERTLLVALGGAR